MKQRIGRMSAMVLLIGMLAGCAPGTVIQVSPTVARGSPGSLPNSSAAATLSPTTTPAGRPTTAVTMTPAGRPATAVPTGVPPASVPATTAPAGISYAGQIQPILNQSCVRCHGSSGGLSLSSYERLMAGGDGGPAVVPGDPENSLLLRYVTGPRPHLLGQEQIDTLVRWILEGALNND